MSLPPNYRKMELFRHGVTQQQIADEVELSHALVNKVVNGTRRNEKIEAAIARAIKMPVEHVFPPRAA